MSQILLTIIVVLGLPKRAAALIAYVKTLIERLTGNTLLPNPTPNIPTITAALTAYESSETAMKTTKGAKEDRAAKRKALVTLLKSLRDNVQQACDANITIAGTIAESVGMRLKAFNPALKAAFAVSQGLVSGSVVCAAKAVARNATYYVSYSVDQTHWTSAPDSMKCTVTISGLAPGQTYYFRVRTLTRKGGMSDYSQIVSLIVK